MLRRLPFAAILIAVLALLAPPSFAATISYPADGWLPAGAAFSWQHPDQGRDFVTNWRGVVQAPGDGCVVEIGADRPYPHGFGPDYPLVSITSGPFAGHVWYVGHTTALVHTGQCFKFGQPLSRADQGHPSQIGITVPGDGGWVELGEDVNGLLGPFSTTGHWYDALLLKTLVVHVPDPPLRFGDHNWRVWGMTRDLADCGWLTRPWFTFNRQVHGAVVAFKRRDHLPLPAHGDRGIVDTRTRKAIRVAGVSCRHLPTLP